MVLTRKRIIDFYTRLLQATFIPREPGYEHPLGYSSDALLFLDGISLKQFYNNKSIIKNIYIFSLSHYFSQNKGTAYRLPDHIQAEGGLGLHIDRNPFDPYLQAPTVTKKLLKYRPIQSWIGLTDHYGSKSGIDFFFFF